MKPTVTVAKALLGQHLVTERRGRVTAGVIVEVEAYGGECPDEAAHSHRGETERTRIMFGPGGFCYVYFIYGMHYCVNVVTEPAGIGAAVLIRALEPLDGIDLMRRRCGKGDKKFTNGPAKLCRALGITKQMYGEDLIGSPVIRIEPGRAVVENDIGVSPRIGISKAKEIPWRFYVKNNEWVSGSSTLRRLKGGYP